MHDPHSTPQYNAPQVSNFGGAVVGSEPAKENQSFFYDGTAVPPISFSREDIEHGPTALAY